MADRTPEELEQAKRLKELNKSLKDLNKSMQASEPKKEKTTKDLTTDELNEKLNKRLSQLSDIEQGNNSTKNFLGMDSEKSAGQGIKGKIKAGVGLKDEESFGSKKGMKRMGGAALGGGLHALGLLTGEAGFNVLASSFMSKRKSAIEKENQLEEKLRTEKDELQREILERQITNLQAEKDQILEDEKAKKDARQAEKDKFAQTKSKKKLAKKEYKLGNLKDKRTLPSLPKPISSLKTSPEKKISDVIPSIGFESSSSKGVESLLTKTNKTLEAILNQLKTPSATKTAILPNPAEQQKGSGMLTKGGAVAGGLLGGYGGWKAGNKLATMFGAEEGGTASKVVGGIGAVGGGLLGAGAGAMGGSLLSKGLSKVPVVGGMLGKATGRAAAEMSGAQPVYVVNADEIGGGAGGGLPGKSLLSRGAGLAKTGLTSLGGLSGGGAMMGAATLGAGAAAGYGLHGTYKAITTGESQQNDIARKVGLVKSKEDIEKGVDSRSMFNPMRMLGEPIDALAEGAAKLTNFATGNKTVSKSQADEETKRMNEAIAKSAAIKAGLQPKANVAKPIPVQLTKEKGAAANTTVDDLNKAKKDDSLLDKMTSFFAGNAFSGDSMMGKAGNMLGKGFGAIGGAINAPINYATSKLTGGKSKSLGEWAYDKMNPEVGQVAVAGETGGRSLAKAAGTVSSGVGDHGGKSYGMYQLSSKQGSLQEFLKANPEQAAKLGDTNAPDFDQKWKAAGADKDFQSAQQKFAQKKYLAPQMDKAKKLGLNTDSKAIQEMLMSTGVQYGENTEVIGKALKGKDVSKMKPEDIINAVQDYKRDSVGERFRSSSGEVQKGVANRHDIAERQRLLQVAQTEQTGVVQKTGSEATTTGAPVTTAQLPQSKSVLAKKIDQTTPKTPADKVKKSAIDKSKTSVDTQLRQEQVKQETEKTEKKLVEKPSGATMVNNVTTTSGGTRTQTVIYTGDRSSFASDLARRYL